MRWLPIPILATVAIYFLLYVPARLEVESRQPAHGRSGGMRITNNWLTPSHERQAGLFERMTLQRLTKSVLPAIEFAALPAPLVIWCIVFAPRLIRRAREASGRARERGG